MRRPPILSLMLGLSLCDCGDQVEPRPEGTLAVSTATSGDDPDPDGYVLTIDASDLVALLPSGTAERDLSPGRHTLQLVGVAEHCSVVPGTSVEVDITARSTTSVAFQVSCPLTGARITVTTTGLDPDKDGYRLMLDGIDRGGIAPNNIVTLRQLEAGSRTIALTGLAPNCAVDGPISRTVTVVTAQVAAVEFTVVCTAAFGVIGATVEASGADVGSRYEALVDGERSFFVEPGGPAYLDAVPVGEHVVSLVPTANCSPETGAQSVTVSAGRPVRDTVEVAFSVTCVAMLPGTLRVTAPTTGPIPAQSYSVWICKPRYDCIFYTVTWSRLGPLAPNDTLTRSVEPARYQLQLRDIPANCHASRIYTNIFTVRYSDTLDVKFPVACSN